MNKIIGLVGFICLLCLMGCKEKEASLDLTFHARYDGEVLTMLDKYAMPNLTLRFTTSDFFVSDIQLIGDDASLSLTDIAFIDFSTVNTTVENAMAGITLEYPDIELNNYHTISFGVGVNPENNSKTPADFTSEDVLGLSEGGSYWPSWVSYVFLRMEGRFDTDENGTFDDSCVFHVGSDQNYVVMELPIELNIEEGKNTLDLYLDHKTLFETTDGEYFDIPSMPTNHQPDLPAIINIARNMPQAWTVE